MRNGIVEIIQRNLVSTGLINKNKKISLLTGKGRQGFQGNIVFWVYSCNSSNPIFWGKTSRTSAGNHYLENEYKAAIHLKTTGLGRHIPSIYSFFEWDGRKVIIEEYIPITNHFREEYMRRGEICSQMLMSQVIEFCKDLQSIELPTGQNCFLEWKKNVNDFLLIYQITDQEKKILNEINSFWEKAQAISRLQHGDLWWTHILSTSAQTFKVIDWEFFRENGFPLADVFQLLGSVSIEHYQIPQTTGDLSIAFKKLSKNTDKFSKSVNNIFYTLTQQALPSHNSIFDLLITHLVCEAVRDYRMLLECSREGYLSLPPDMNSNHMPYTELIKQNRYFKAFKEIIAERLYK